MCNLYFLPPGSLETHNIMVLRYMSLKCHLPMCSMVLEHILGAEIQLWMKTTKPLDFSRNNVTFCSSPQSAALKGR